MVGLARLTAFPTDGWVARERRTYFAIDSVNEAMFDHGWAVLPQRLDQRLVDDLSALHRGVVDQIEPDRSGRFLPTMLISRPELRARLWDGMRQIMCPTVEPLFLPHATELLGGSFVSKPGSPNSFRSPHQDPSVLDEAHHVSVSLWVPLSDSRTSNGTLCILPGSHRMGNHVRPPDVDSIDEAVQEVSLTDSVPVELDAGHIVAIDGAVIHHSPPNTSGAERVAAICAVRPAGAAMHYVRSDKGAPSGLAEIYEVGPEMYRSGDLLNPSFDRAPLVGRADYRPASLEDLRASWAVG